MKLRLAAPAALAATAFTLPVLAGPISGVEKRWSYANQTGYSSEIGAWDRKSAGLFVAGGKGIELLDLAGNRLGQFDAAAAGFGEVNSVSIANGVAAVSFTATGATPQAFAGSGTVRFFDTAAFSASGGTAGYLGKVDVGAVPDMLTWNAAGSVLLVANEGERRVISGTTHDPEGSVSLIRFNAANPALSSVTKIGFDAFDGQESLLRAAGVRIGTGLRASVALEPEYIAIAPNGQQAQVVLQEANAVAFVDLATATVTGIKGLGKKDFSLSGNRIDPSDSDGGINLRSVPVKALYQPDAVAAYEVGGRTYYVMANEGDAATDDSDIVRFRNGAVTLDSTVFDGTNLPTQAQLKPDGVLGRLNIVRNGATGDGSTTNMKEIVAIGGRSFSIRDDAGGLVYDSGELIEQAVIAAGLYDDGRSDDKGVEPEGVALFHAAGHTIAAIGLERTKQGAFALFDVTDPEQVEFLQLVTTGSTAEFRTEGLTAFESGGRIYLAMLNEDNSNTTVLFEVKVVPEPASAALAMAALMALAAVGRRRGGSSQASTT